MGGRYYLTGVQIGMLKAFAELGKMEKLIKVLDVIESEQYICDAEQFVELLGNLPKEMITQV